MKPDNQYTTAEQRFFYPINNEVEHHETLDTSELPEIVRVEGERHFVVITKDDTEEAYDPHWGPSHIPEGWVVSQVAGFREGANPQGTDGVLEAREISDVVDKSRDSYMPQEGDQVVVKLNQLGMRRADLAEEADIPEDGVFILPHDAPMPTAEELGLGEDVEARYEFIGFINTEDKLVIPRYLMNSPMSKVADLCIANALAQNSLEYALLMGDMSSEATLMGMLKVEPKIASYLKYFDEKHGTNYFPETDPKDEHDRFPELTEEERTRYFWLQEVAHRFLTEPRHPDAGSSS